MIAVVITIVVVCILIMYKIYITNKTNRKRLKKIEQRIDEYYKRKENPLMERFRDIEQ